jgi:hypothetical protein
MTQPTFSKRCIRGTWYVLQDGYILSNGLPSEKAADRFIMFAEGLHGTNDRYTVTTGLVPDGHDGDEV